MRFPFLPHLFSTVLKVLVLAFSHLVRTKIQKISRDIWKEELRLFVFAKNRNLYIENSNTTNKTKTLESKFYKKLKLQDTKSTRRNLYYGWKGRRGRACLPSMCKVLGSILSQWKEKHLWCFHMLTMIYKNGRKETIKKLLIDQRDNL